MFLLLVDTQFVIFVVIIIRPHRSTAYVDAAE